jgi:hypothetical protein
VAGYRPKFDAASVRWVDGDWVEAWEAGVGVEEEDAVLVEQGTAQSKESGQ